MLIAGSIWLALVAGCAPPEPPAPEVAPVPVRSEIVETEIFQPSIILVGRVEPAARIPVQALSSGTIRYAPRFTAGLRTGEKVTRGELLFTLDNEDSRLRVSEAELAARAASNELERTRRGYEGGVVPEAELRAREIEAEQADARLASARRVRQRLSHHADRDGVLLVERAYPAGSEIPGGERIAEVSADGAPRVEGWAAAADLEKLRPGLEVRCWLSGGDRVAGSGVVREVSAEVGAQGTARVVVDITEAKALPPAGEGLELQVLLEARAGAVTVPEAALMPAGGASVVYVLEPIGDRFEVRRREVLIGGRGARAEADDGASRVEVLDGLREGERIAIEGVELLADGVLAVEAGSASEEGA